LQFDLEASCPNANVFVHFTLQYILHLLAPQIKYWSTPKQAERVMTKVLLNESGATGVYYDDKSDPMLSPGCS